MKKQYVVHYGKVPFSCKTFSNYSDVAVFVKKQLDSGVFIHSISKEYVEPGEFSDNRDCLVKSVDIINDR